MTNTKLDHEGWRERFDKEIGPSAKVIDYFYSPKILAFIETELARVRRETLNAVYEIAVSDRTLADGHSVVHKKRHREVTIEDDAVCKCFRQAFLSRLNKLDHEK